MDFNFWITTLFFISSCNLSISVEISDEWKGYINDITAKFEKGIIGKDFQVILPPVSPITETPNPSQFTYPNIYIWDPLFQREDIFKQFQLTCPEHKNMCLLPKQWTDGSTNALNPRVILDNQGPSLLLTRNYYCHSGRHYIRGTNGDLLAVIRMFVQVPFKLTHKYAFTLDFAHRLRDFLSNGVSFNYLQANYIERQLQDFTDRKERYNCHRILWAKICSSTEDIITDESSEEIWSKYKQKIIGLCPSDDLLGDIFVKDFEDRKSKYEDAMRATTATALMADHTFKVC